MTKADSKWWMVRVPPVRIVLYRIDEDSVADDDVAGHIAHSGHHMELRSVTQQVGILFLRNAGTV